MPWAGCRGLEECMARELWRTGISEQERVHGFVDLDSCL